MSALSAVWDGYLSQCDRRATLLAEGVQQAVALLAPKEGQPQSHTEYQARPVEWIVEKLGVPGPTLRWSLNEGYDGHRWDGDPDPLAKLLTSLAGGRDVGVESATGTGKTFLGACIVLWFLACFEDSTVVTTAPKEQQLTLHIWKEISRLWPRFQLLFPRAELTTLRIRMAPGSDVWAAHGFACGVGATEESATRAQGFHAEHMLIVTEETPGIDAAIMTAFENTSTDDHNLRLAFGNPDHQHDALHLFCQSPGVVPVRISALDHPNVVTGMTIVPGAVVRSRVDRRREKYGEDSRLYQSRVRGISPAEAVDALVKWAWCKEAAGRYSDAALREGLPALGVDVANSENGDLGAIARGLGACLLEVSSFPCPSAAGLGGKVAAEMRAVGIKPDHVGVDSVGVGADTMNTLMQLGHLVQALNGGLPPAEVGVRHDGEEEERYFNLRAQMWWQIRLDLQYGRISLPDDEELFQDLITPKWETRGGKIIVEAKEKIRERLGRSPDKGDAAVYWNWVRRRVPVPAAKVFPTHTAALHQRRREILQQTAQGGDGLPALEWHGNNAEGEGITIEGGASIL